MRQVYIVVATRDSEVEVCEWFDYSDVDSAIGRAFQLASDKAGKGRTDLFNASPDAENLPDGSYRWVFMNTNKQSVMVYCSESKKSLLSSKDPLNFVGTTHTSVPQSPITFSDGYHHSLPLRGQMLFMDGYMSPIHNHVVPTPPPYDFMKLDLPAGWDIDGKAILMKDFLANPSNMKDPILDLSFFQKRALVLARVHKSPYYTVIPKGYSGFSPTRRNVLENLEEQTPLATSIIDAEIELLSDLRKELMSGTLRAL